MTLQKYMTLQNEIETRQCKMCGEVLPIGDFYRITNSKPYRYGRCKRCYNQVCIARADKDRGKRRETQRKYYQTDNGKEKMANYYAEHKDALREAFYKRLKNVPQEVKDAHNRVQYDLRVRKLHREPCLVCGIEKAEAHHPDYSKPLDIIWLCKEHHEKIHRKDI